VSEQDSNGRQQARGGDGRADASEVKRQARQWTDDVLECRTYGHIWRPHSARYNSRYKYWQVVQRCQRCTSERRRQLTQRGKRTSSYIDYVDGYLSEGLGRITGEAREILELATITRVFTVERVSGKAAEAEPPTNATLRELQLEFGEAS
jgi:hypothetical protein